MIGPLHCVHGILIGAYPFDLATSPLTLPTGLMKCSVSSSLAPAFELILNSILGFSRNSNAFHIISFPSIIHTMLFILFFSHFQNSYLSDKCSKKCEDFCIAFLFVSSFFGYFFINCAWLEIVFVLET